MAMASTHTSCFDFDPFNPFLHSFMEGDYLNNNQTIVTNNINNSASTFSPLESSGSDQYFESKNDFEVNEFFSFEGWNNLNVQQQLMGFGNGTDECFGGGCNNIQLEEENTRIIRNTKNIKERVAFRMKSEIDVVDDGYKWRKYGKKMVKNSPNPRNYYRCAIESCPVKKRVERDRDDMKYVITTYEGNHNHQTQSNY